MSLIRHVNTNEGTDREQPQLESLFNAYPVGGYGTIGTPQSLALRQQPSYQRSLRRVLSYDVVAKPEESSQSTNPTGATTAYKVSTARRIAQVCFTILSCWLASGIVFGYAALKPVLIAEGVYRELCTAEELRAGVEVCYEQDLRLNVYFASASTTCNISALLVGAILDRYGSRTCAVLGSLFLAIGTTLMALAFSIPEFDGYIMGNIGLALGGTFIFVPSYSIANAFPRFSGTIVAAVTGAFDCSAAIYLFYRIAYEASGGAFTPAKFFFAYRAVPVLIFIGQFTLMKKGGYKTVSQLEVKVEKAQDSTRDVHDSDEDLSRYEVNHLRSQRRDRRKSKLQELDKLLGDAGERQQRAEKEEERQIASGVWGALHGKSATEQVLSPWFILIACLTVLQMLRMNFFIATIKQQYVYMLGSETLARKVNEFFDVALPVGGLVATPFIGLLLDSVSTATTLTVLVSLITAVGIVGCLPFLWAGYLNVILFVLLRPLYYSAMSDYAAKVFGFATFGRVYGLIIGLSGAVNLSQPAIDALNHEVFHENPIPINITLASLGFLFGVSLVAYVWVHTRRMREEMESLADEWQRNRTIMEEDESDFTGSLLDLRH